MKTTNPTQPENRWTLTDEVKAQYKPIIKNFLDSIYSMSDEEVKQSDSELFTLSLSDTRLRPYTLLTLMQEEFGYEREEFNDNGWELDYWITIQKPDCSYPCNAEMMRIHGCGMTFELNLTVGEFL